MWAALNPYGVGMDCNGQRLWIYVPLWNVCTVVSRPVFTRSLFSLMQEFEDHFDDEIDFTPPAEDTPSMQSPAEVYTLAVSPVALPGPPHLQPPARIAGQIQTVCQHVHLQTRAHIHIIHIVHAHTNGTTTMFLLFCCLRCHFLLSLSF